MSQPRRTQSVPSPEETTPPRALSADDVVGRIWDTARWKPLVLVSSVLDDRPKVSLLPRLASPRLASPRLGTPRHGDAAEIIVVTASEAWSLQRLVPRGFEAYGGAIRAVLPDATEQDPAERHPLFFTFDKDNPDDTVSRMSACLTRNGFTRTKCNQPQQPSGTPRQQRRAEKLRDALRTTPSHAAVSSSHTATTTSRRSPTQTAPTHTQNKATQPTKAAPLAGVPAGRPAQPGADPGCGADHEAVGGVRAGVRLQRP